MGFFIQKVVVVNFFIVIKVVQIEDLILVEQKSLRVITENSIYANNVFLYVSCVVYFCNFKLCISVNLIFSVNKNRNILNLNEPCIIHLCNFIVIVFNVPNEVNLSENDLISSNRKIQLKRSIEKNLFFNLKKKEVQDVFIVLVIILPVNSDNLIHDSLSRADINGLNVVVDNDFLQANVMDVSINLNKVKDMEKLTKQVDRCNFRIKDNRICAYFNDIYLKLDNYVGVQGTQIQDMNEVIELDDNNFVNVSLTKRI